LGLDEFDEGEEAEENEEGVEIEGNGEVESDADEKDKLKGCRDLSPADGFETMGGPFSKQGEIEAEEAQKKVSREHGYRR